MIKLDPWQREFLKTAGDKLLCTGRQVGKSVVCGIDAGEYAINNKNKVVLMIAPTERQAYALFEKTLNYILQNKPKMVKTGRHRPTRSKINLSNGTIIWCLPTGLSGIGIRFLTVSRLYADEASRIPAPVWDAVTPMLLTTGGDTILLSTPFGTEGFFYDVLINKNDAFNTFTRFRTDSERVIREREICETWKEAQRDKALARINQEKGRMTALAFAQEYMGQPLQDLKQVFSDSLLEKCLVLQKRPDIWPERDYYLGQDIAGMGRDTSAWAILDGTERDFIEQVDNLTKKRLTTPERVQITLDLEKKYCFNKIGVDDGGLGSGDFGYLLKHDETRRKTISLNNARRSISKDGKLQKRLLKEDMYNNLLAMMEWGKIKLLKDDEIFHSLRSIQFEITDRAVKYSGADSHITEALIRAAWLISSKNLNIYIY
jgi:hypothetical protein